MLKETLLQKIIATLQADYNLLTCAAQAAHAAATHAECLPDNKYDTTALEASYVAQGQANRAQEIRQALEIYRMLALRPFTDGSPIRLTALVTIEAEDGSRRQLFLGPAAGGLKLIVEGEECLLITPESGIGRALLGQCSGDEVEVGDGAVQKIFTVIAVR